MMFGAGRRVARRTARRTSRRMVRPEMGNSTPTPGTAPQRAAPGIEDRLQQLADLHSAGALTDDEFAKAKAKLLAS